MAFTYWFCHSPFYLTANILEKSFGCYFFRLGLMFSLSLTWEVIKVTHNVDKLAVPNIAPILHPSFCKGKFKLPRDVFCGQTSLIPIEIIVMSFKGIVMP